MFSGLMLSQYTADTQIVEQKILSAPAFIQSIPAAADQEDFVSMGMNSALKTRQILDVACGVLGIELMAAAQALDSGSSPGWEPRRQGRGPPPRRLLDEDTALPRPMPCSPRSAQASSTPSSRDRPPPPTDTGSADRLSHLTVPGSPGLLGTVVA
jgi:hypothetical protein